MTSKPNRILGLVLLLFFVETAAGLLPVIRSRRTDLDAYLGAARALTEGTDPYATPLPYLYPPILAVCLVPFLGLPRVAVGCLWVAFSAALITLSAFLVSRARASRQRQVLLAAIFFAPFAATQWNQQVNGLALLALVGARTWLDREESRGGVALGLSAAIKPLAVLPLAWLVLTRRWRAATAGLLVLMAGFAVVIPFLGLRGMGRSLERVFEIVTRARVEVYGANISVAGIWTRLIEPGRPDSTIRLVLGYGILGVSIVASLVPRLRPSRAVDLLVAASLLAVNTSWVHHSAIAFPLVASLEKTAMVAVLVLYLMADRGVSAGWHTGDFVSPFGPLASAAGTAALMILWLVALSRALADPRPDDTALKQEIGLKPEDL